MHRILPIAVAAISLASCTSNPSPQSGAAAASDRQCFVASSVSGFHALDRDTVLVTVGANRTYQLDILGTCQDIDWSNRIGIRSTSGSSWVCRGQDAELIVPGPAGVDRCPVLGVRLLSPEEVRAARRRS